MNHPPRPGRGMRRTAIASVPNARSATLLSAARSRKMRDAHLLVANHHCFSPIWPCGRTARPLPDVGAVVWMGPTWWRIPPASTLACASPRMVLNIGCAGYSCQKAAKGFGLFAPGRGPRGHQLWPAVADLFHEVPRLVGLGPHDGQKVVAQPLQLVTNVPELMHQLSTELEILGEDLVGQDEDSRAELRSLRGQGIALSKMLEAFLDQSMPDHVYWLEREGRRRQPVLYSAPIEVAPILPVLFGTLRTVILTSAT